MNIVTSVYLFLDMFLSTLLVSFTAGHRRNFTDFGQVKIKLEGLSEGVSDAYQDVISTLLLS